MFETHDRQCADAIPSFTQDPTIGCTQAAKVSIGSKRRGIEYPSGRIFRQRRAHRKRQTPAPELPGTIAEPARLGAEHDPYEMRLPQRCLQLENIPICPEVHDLRNDAILGKGRSVDRSPPQISAAEFID
ncbi:MULTISPECIES: hypothetical protein [unclassified Bradyrhizobium]|uniref:hypothetical protein n=1 Tax=unclassified Bradyrhizobium TaxID=2631580 RepID=UPI001FF74401|nr:MULTISPECIES: hypothetical protein [unclassified Bradyrhizobium]MCK1708944.1 hypothetical protein [Bradyrhizobium sp. 143]MCK1727029.1 hypothetical protein [Bradyrhizobium sp. 142]